MYLILDMKLADIGYNLNLSFDTVASYSEARNENQLMVDGYIIV